MVTHAENPPDPAARLAAILRRADAAIIVPPFTPLQMPHLGAHVLQACARARGFETIVIYGGMLMAAEAGVRVYDDVSACATPLMLGERVFCRAAYGLPHLGHQPHHALRQALRVRHGASPVIRYAELLRLSKFAAGWTDRLGAALASAGIPVIGATTVFEQTASAIAILNAVKRHAPSTTTIIGGANCAGPMAHGIASLSSSIDFIFAGEAEEVFPGFLEAHQNGALPPSRIIDSQPCQNLDAVPTTDFGDFYEQARAWLGGSLAEEEMILPYESSRGCWWGQKHHCTFCGVQNMRFREKSPDRVMSELTTLVAAHPNRTIRNADDIMPSSYFRTLLPRLAAELPGLDIFYEQKANLTLDKVRALRAAGVTSIQPGIEALSTPLLQRMRKGIEAHRNLALMRYARATGVGLRWNLLYGFPGDAAEDYEHYLELLPLIHHLSPPQGFGPVQIIRFSPYFKEPGEHGVSDIRPAAVYDEILPDGADFESLAYYFDAQFDSVSTNAPELIAAIESELERWRGAWARAEQPPLLQVLHFEPDAYVLADTRRIAGHAELEIIDPRKAAAALVPRRMAVGLDDETAWALDRKLLFALDGWYAPLVTAAPAILAAFETAPVADVAAMRSRASA